MVRARGRTVGIPPGWKDDGTRLMAPNGQSVVLRFRWYILTHPWAPDDWPLENEHYERLLDITAPEQGDGMVQYFRKSILGWQEQSNLVVELCSGAVALAWQQQAWSQSSLAPVTSPSYPPTAMPPPRISSGNTLRLARVEKQVQMLISGLRAGTKPNEVAGTIEDQLEMVARESTPSKVLYRPFSSPRMLLHWLLLLIGLCCGDVLVWAVSSLIHDRPVFSLPLLALGTVALSACCYFLIALKPPSQR